LGIRENLVSAESAGGIPRWVQIPVGVLLLIILLFCLAGSVFLVIQPSEKNPPLAIIVGSIMVLVSLWGVEKSVRLIFDWRTHGGLMGPISLRIVATFFLVMPVIALVFGQLQKLGIVGYIQAIAYVFIAFNLFRLARARSVAQPRAECRRG
jgi:hypothetical protein